MDDLNKRITKINRQIEQLIKQREKDIARRYARVLVTIRAEMAKQYEQYEKDGKLSLQEMLKYDRLKKLNQRVSFLMQSHYKDIYSQIGDTISNAYTEGYYQTAYNLEMHIKKKIGFRAVRPETLKAMLDNPVAGLTLKRTLQQRRAYIIQQIQRQITLGLQNNESYSSMAKRLKSELEGDTVKAMRIVRTEGHRVQESAKHDAMDYANSNGVVMHKQWNSLEDERVRGKKGIANHRKLNNKKIAMDQLFDDGLSKGPAPGQLPAAASSINCRCFLTYSVEKVVKKDLKDIEQTTFEQWKKENIKEVELPKEEETKQSKDEDNKTTFKSVSEVAKYSKKFADNVDIDGLNLDTAEVVASTLDKMFTEFPRPKFEALNTKTSKASVGTFTGTMNTYTNVKVGRLAIGKMLNNENTVKGIIEETKRGQFAGKKAKYTRAGIVESTVIHEFAHSLYDSRLSDKNMLKEISKIKGEYTRGLNKINKKYRVQTMFEAENTMSAEDLKAYKELYISSYAETNNDEFVAECFADYYTSDKPSPISIKIVEVVKKYFKMYSK